jgi:hypothetical protein
MTRAAVGRTSDPEPLAAADELGQLAQVRADLAEPDRPAQRQRELEAEHGVDQREVATPARRDMADRDLAAVLDEMIALWPCPRPTSLPRRRTGRNHRSALT